MYRIGWSFLFIMFIYYRALLLCMYENISIIVINVRLISIVADSKNDNNNNGESNGEDDPWTDYLISK